MAKMTKSVAKGKKVEVEKKSIFSPASIRTFVDEVKVEFTKIVWPDKKTTISLTGVVVVFSILASLYLGSVDLILGKIIDTVLR